LSTTIDDLFTILEHVNDNAYMIELLETYIVSFTFSVANLSPYYGEDYNSTEENTELYPT